jgi:hypothetical protein
MTNVHRPSASSSASPSASPLPLSSATFYESHRIRLHRFFNPSPPSPSSSTTSPSTVEDENENFVAGSTELLTVDELGRPAVEEVEKKEVKGWFNVSLASSLFWVSNSSPESLSELSVRTWQLMRGWYGPSSDGFPSGQKQVSSARGWTGHVRT